MEKKHWIIVGVIVFLAAAIGGGLWWYNADQKKKKAASSAKSGAANVPPPGVGIDDFLDQTYSLTPEIAKGPLGVMSRGKVSAFIRAYVNANKKQFEWFTPEYHEEHNFGGLSFEDNLLANVAWLMDTREADADGNKGWGWLITKAA